MCQAIFLGSVEPLPESDALEVRRADDPEHPHVELDGLRAALPEARHFYQVGDCQCHFGLSTESEIESEMFESDRAFVRGVNAFVAGLASFLADNLAQTRVWVFWQWGGIAVSPGCAAGSAPRRTSAGRAS
jgi:hypothetical protein